MAATTIIPNLDNIEREHRNIKRKILRCASSGDIRRLLGIRAELARIREDLERMKEDYEPPKPAFRRSYGYDALLEDIGRTGRTTTKKKGRGGGRVPSR